jgi:PAS domain S-box-containing protein
MRIFGSIAFKIWISCNAVLLLVLLFFTLYYPSIQRNELTEFKREEIHETTHSLALAVELSLRQDDFVGLKKTIERTAEKEDFEYVAVVVKEGEKMQVIASFPEISDAKIVKRDNEKFIYEQSPFDSEILKGEVIIAFSKEKINQTITAMNRPIYFTIIVAFLVSLVIFTVVASIISRPVRKLTRYTQLLKDENYSEPIPILQKQDEISTLQNAIAELQKRLITSREENLRLTEGLEEQIKSRTNELKATNTRLIDAQKTARIANFSLNLSSLEWESSSNLFEFLGLPNQSGMHDFLALMDAESHEDWALILNPDYWGNNHRFECDLKFHQLDGSENTTLLLTARTKIDENDGGIVVLGTLQDITYRKQIENELEELSLVAKNATNCVVITDKNQHIKWVNNSLLKLTGYSYGEVVGQTPRMFQCEKTDPKTKTFIRERLEKGLDVEVEIINRGKNGHEYWLELNIVPLRDKHNEIYGYMAIETDITDLKKSEEEIRKMNESLENRVLENTKKNLDLSRMIVEQEKLATIGEISAGIAHDLNTPLGAAKVGAESLSYVINELMTSFPKLTQIDQESVIQISKNLSPTAAIGGLQRMKNEQAMVSFLNEHDQEVLQKFPSLAQKLTDCQIMPENGELILDILNVSNPLLFLQTLHHLQMLKQLQESIIISTERATNVVKDVRAFINKGITPERQPIDVKKNIQVVLNVFNHELRKQVQVDTLMEDGQFIMGYDIKLFQLWSNIIKNSLDAMEGQTDKRIKIEVSTLDDDKLRVSISNNGPVIPEEIREQIFKKFFSTKREKNGTGLGLSIVRNVVEEHNGRISVESSEQLTTFCIDFPIALGNHS